MRLKTLDLIRGILKRAVATAASLNSLGHSIPPGLGSGTCGEMSPSASIGPTGESTSPSITTEPDTSGLPCESAAPEKKLPATIMRIPGLKNVDVFLIRLLKQPLSSSTSTCMNSSIDANCTLCLVLASPRVLSALQAACFFFSVMISPLPCTVWWSHILSNHDVL